MAKRRRHTLLRLVRPVRRCTRGSTILLRLRLAILLLLLRRLTVLLLLLLRGWGCASRCTSRSSASSTSCALCCL
jgi:hypothetical protein